MQFGLNPFFQAAAAYGADLNATAGKQDANPEVSNNLIFSWLYRTETDGYFY